MTQNRLARPDLTKKINSPYNGNMPDSNYLELLNRIKSEKRRGGIEWYIKKYRISAEDLAKIRKDLHDYEKSKNTKNQVIIKPIFEIVIEEPKLSDIEEQLNKIKELYSGEIRKVGEQVSFKEGFVYLIENPNYPGMIKAGMTIDYESRLNSYNIYDPYDAFSFIKVKYVKDRRSAETELLKVLRNNSSYNKGEWFKIDKVLALSLFE